jgi:chorismate-pyruvate lyase
LERRLQIVSDACASTPDLATLVGLFYPRIEQVGRFDEVDRRDLERDYRMLLAHDSHMTVTVERFHNGPVDVRVLDTRQSGTHYARRILLTRQADGGVVLFGIMRLDFAYVSPEVRRQVESQAAPLGRILIQHDVLREVHLTRLYRVAPGDELRGLFGMSAGQVTYGRTAIIHCNGQPAVELLEIVAPV